VGPPCGQLPVKWNQTGLFPGFKVKAPLRKAFIRFIRPHKRLPRDHLTSLPELNITSRASIRIRLMIHQPLFMDSLLNLVNYPTHDVSSRGLDESGERTPHLDRVPDDGRWSEGGWGVEIQDTRELPFVHEGAVEEVVDCFPRCGVCGGRGVGSAGLSGASGFLVHWRPAIPSFVFWRRWGIGDGICGEVREWRSREGG